MERGEKGLISNVHKELLSNFKRHPYADINPEERRQSDVEDATMVVKISSGRYQPDLDLAEYYNDWRETLPQLPPQLPQSADPDIIFSQPMYKPITIDQSKLLRSASTGSSSPPFRPKRSDSITRLDSINKEFDEAANELSVESVGTFNMEGIPGNFSDEPPEVPPPPPPPFAAFEPFDNIPMPDMLILDNPNLQGLNDEPNDYLVDENALHSEVDMWSNVSVVSDKDATNTNSPVKSILKNRRENQLESDSATTKEAFYPEKLTKPITAELNPIQDEINSSFCIEPLDDIFQPTPSPKPSQKPSQNCDANDDMDEIDRQLEILMNNLKTPSSEFSTTCNKCCGVIGLNQGCASMGIDYHISCFTCITCGSNLHGREFRATLSTEVYCSTCYDQLRERCANCTREIEGRAINSSNKSYHPNCFNCKKCERNIQYEDCTTFNDDVVCIQCFHSLSAVECVKCKQPILPETGSMDAVQIKLGDKSFHKTCFACHDCKVKLYNPDSGGCFFVDFHYCCAKCGRKRRKNNFITKRTKPTIQQLV